MRLDAGGTLYQDVFWVFPPGHLLGAWLGHMFAPPGIVAARVVYSVFNVALVGVIYLLGRRIMPAPYAIAAALLVALGAGGSHLYQYLFGYRYLVWSGAALLCFARRLDTGSSLWMTAAGALLGVSLCFRISPAFAGLAAIGLATLVASREPTRWLRDWLALGLGLMVASAPVAIWLSWSVGAGPAWHEIFVRPIVMTNLQSFPVPDLFWPDIDDRTSLRRALLAVEFRAYSLVYFGYALALAVALGRRLRSRGADREVDAFPHALLLAIVVWGGVFFTRAFGRADQAHLNSALPPVCLLLAHLAHLLTSRRPFAAGKLRLPSSVVAALLVLCSAAWLYGREFDRYLTLEFRGAQPFVSTDEGIRVRSMNAQQFDLITRVVKERTRPGDTILDLSASPLFHVVTGRFGVGGQDLVMPGTFANGEEEQAFVERLRANPPALVIRSHDPFDELAERGVDETAPALAHWVRQNYRDASGPLKWVIMMPVQDHNAQRSPRALEP
jgi:hypothetical protein